MRVIIYYRVSSKHQQEKQSIALQKTKLHKFAGDKGYEIVLEFQDDGISGEAIDSRPGFKQVLDAIKNQQADILLVYMVDRIGRFKDIEDRHEVTKLLVKRHVSVDSPYEGFFDWKQEEDIFRLEAKLIDGRRENRAKGIRVSEGHQEVRRRGGWSGGRLPYAVAYDKSTMTFHIDKRRHRTLKTIVELLTKGYGLGKVARVLNAEQHPLPEYGKRKKAKRWWSGVVRGLVRNDFYFTGVIKPKNERTSCGEQAIPVDTGLKLLEEEAVKEARASMKKRGTYDKSKRGQDDGERPAFLLGGLLKCGECGWAVSPHRSRKPGRKLIRYYRCFGYKDNDCSQSKGYRADMLEEKVWDYIVENLIRNPSALEHAILAQELIVDADRDTLRNIIHNAEQELAGLEGERKRLLRAYKKDDLPEDEYDEEIESVKKERARVEEELSKAQRQLEQPEETKRAIRESTRFLADLVSFGRLFGPEFEREEDAFEQLPKEEQQRIKREEPDHPYMKLLREIEEVQERPAYNWWMAEFYGDDRPNTDPETTRLTVDQRRIILLRILGPEGFIAIRREADRIRFEINGFLRTPQGNSPVVDSQRSSWAFTASTRPSAPFSFR